MIKRWLMRIRFDSWIGTLDGRPTLWSRDLLRLWGWRVSLHRFVGPDDPGCFHTHPAWALRVILTGGYVEELMDGRSFAWLSGMAGLVRPALSHRIARLIEDDTFTLWVRAPKRAEIELQGPGWPGGDHA